MSKSRPIHGQMSPESCRKAVISVSEMARACGLSRARFYALLGEGFFPAPKRHPTTNRPYFDREGQAACTGVRSSNLGVNGQPILFYSVRVEGIAPPPSRRSNPPRMPSVSGASDPRTAALVEGLKQLGLNAVTEATVQQALRAAYPEGTAGLEDAALLPTLFRLIRTSNPPNSNGMH